MSAESQPVRRILFVWIGAGKKKLKTILQGIAYRTRVLSYLGDEEPMQALRARLLHLHDHVCGRLTEHESTVLI
jgi:hypothetical protein